MEGRPPLRPETRAGQPWMLAHAAGMLGLVLGGLALLVAGLSTSGLWATPSYALTIPFLVATVAAAVVSLGRREGVIALPLVGVALAGCAMVLGWFVIVGIVIVVTLVIILILSQLM